MIIEICKLKFITESILSRMELQGETVEIPVDLYWEINEGQRYNVYEDPHDIGIGQLSDDWSELEKLLESNLVPVNYHLILLSSILRVIGEKITM